MVISVIEIEIEGSPTYKCGDRIVLNEETAALCKCQSGIIMHPIFELPWENRFLPLQDDEINIKLFVNSWVYRIELDNGNEVEGSEYIIKGLEVKQEPTREELLKRVEELEKEVAELQEFKFDIADYGQNDE